MKKPTKLKPKTFNQSKQAHKSSVANQFNGEYSNEFDWLDECIAEAKKELEKGEKSDLDKVIMRTVTCHNSLKDLVIRLSQSLFVLEEELNKRGDLLYKLLDKRDHPSLEQFKEAQSNFIAHLQLMKFLRQQLSAK